MRPQKPFKANTLKFHGISIHITRKKKDKEEKKGNKQNWEKMKNSSPKKLSANCWPTVGQQLADSRPTVGRQSDDSQTTVRRQSANCWPIVGMKLSHLSPPYCFGFFRDQSPRNLSERALRNDAAIYCRAYPVH